VWIYWNKAPEEIFKEEVEMLRKEGARLPEELTRQQLRQEKIGGTSSHWDSSKHRIKIKWNAEKNDPTTMRISTGFSSNTKT
jgi:hypothetical protein